MERQPRDSLCCDRGRGGDGGSFPKFIAWMEMIVSACCVLYGCFKFRRYFTHEDKIKMKIEANMGSNLDKQVQDKYHSMMTNTGLFIISNVLELAMGYILLMGVVNKIPKKIRIWLIFRKIMMTLLGVEALWNLVYKDYWDTFTSIFWILCTAYFIRVVQAYMKRQIVLANKIVEETTRLDADGIPINNLNKSDHDAIQQHADGLCKICPPFCSCTETDTKEKRSGPICCTYRGCSKFVAWTEIIFSAIFLAWATFKLISFFRDSENVTQLSQEWTELGSVFGGEKGVTFQMNGIIRLLALLGDFTISLLELVFAIILLIGIRRQNPRLMGIWVTFRKIEIYARAVHLFWSIISVHVWDSLCSIWWLFMSYFDIQDVMGYRKEIECRIKKTVQNEDEGLELNSFKLENVNCDTTEVGKS